jgi:hypothetical protein
MAKLEIIYLLFTVYCLLLSLTSCKGGCDGLLASAPPFSRCYTRAGKKIAFEIIEKISPTHKTSSVSAEKFCCQKNNLSNLSTDNFKNMQTI